MVIRRLIIDDARMLACVGVISVGGLIATVIEGALTCNTGHCREQPRVEVAEVISGYGSLTFPTTINATYESEH